MPGKEKRPGAGIATEEQGGDDRIGGWEGGRVSCGEELVTGFLEGATGMGFEVGGCLFADGGVEEGDLAGDVSWPLLDYGG